MTDRDKEKWTEEWSNAPDKGPVELLKLGYIRFKNWWHDHE